MTNLKNIDLDRLISQRLGWQLPIIAMRAKMAAANILRDAKIDPDMLRRPLCKDGEEQSR